MNDKDLVDELRGMAIDGRVQGIHRTDSDLLDEAADRIEATAGVVEALESLLNGRGDLMEQERAWAAIAKVRGSDKEAKP